MNIWHWFQKKLNKAIAILQPYSPDPSWEWNWAVAEKRRGRGRNRIQGVRRHTIAISLYSIYYIYYILYKLYTIYTIYYINYILYILYTILLYCRGRNRIQGVQRHTISRGVVWSMTLHKFCITCTFLIMSLHILCKQQWHSRYSTSCIQ